MKVNNNYQAKITKRYRLKKPSDEALIGVVLLGLFASISDGKPDNVEINTLREGFSKLYIKESSEVIPYIQSALRKIHNINPDTLLESSFKKLKDELNQSELLEVFDYVSDILVADGKVVSEEEEYLAKIADKFDLLEILRTVVPTIER